MNAHQYNGRLIPVEIAGKTCYFNFSLRAVKSVMEKYKGLENLESGMNSDNESEMIGTMADVFALLISEGQNYLRIVEGLDDIPCFTSDELETVLSMPEMLELKDKFGEAIVAGSSREVEVKDDPKNAKTGRKNLTSPGTSTGGSKSATKPVK